MNTGSLPPASLVVISHLISSHSWLFCVVDCIGEIWQENAALSVVSTRIHSADEIQGRPGILHEEQAFGYRKECKQAGEMAQCGKCLPLKLEDLTLMPTTLIKTFIVVALGR